MIHQKTLTARQLEVLTLAAQGYGNEEIGKKLWITVDTVKVHLKRIYLFLNARDRAHAVYIAMKKGYIS